MDISKPNNPACDLMCMKKKGKVGQVCWCLSDVILQIGYVGFQNGNCFFCSIEINIYNSSVKVSYVPELQTIIYSIIKHPNLSRSPSKHSPPSQAWMLFPLLSTSISLCVSDCYLWEIKNSTQCRRSRLISFHIGIWTIICLCSFELLSPLSTGSTSF